MLELAPGEKVKLLSLHRNVYDENASEGLNKEGQSYTPKYFFKRSILTFSHDKDLKGKAQWWRDGSTAPYAYELDIQNQRGGWGPLEGRNLSEFPKSTLVGWRGPLIVYGLLSHAPNVYWDGTTSAFR